MYSDLESNESKRREVVSSLYWSLMQGWNIPLSIQDYYGLTEDYRLFHQLEGMAPDEYLRKRQTGEVPDILEVDARLTHAVEKIFESVCPRPPAEYLDKLNGELERLGSIAASPGSVHDPIHIRPDFLVKYGIDRSSPEDVIRKQAEKAYRELDARFVRMTGRRPYADEFFRISGPARTVSSEQHCGENRTSPSVRSRKAARWDSELTEKIYQPLKINDMKKRILTALCCICLLSAGRAHAQWVVTDPGNLAQGIINAAKNIVHTSSTASNMVKNFQETVKIYQQGKEYYDGLRKVKNLVRDARKVQQTILMVGDITEIYVTSYERMLSDPLFHP